MGLMLQFIILSQIRQPIKDPEFENSMGKMELRRGSTEVETSLDEEEVKDTW